jgi:hypothetical protein
MAKKGALHHTDNQKRHPKACQREHQPPTNHLPTTYQYQPERRLRNSYRIGLVRFCRLTVFRFLQAKEQ